MISVCFYFEVHQPFRLRKNYSFFDIGKDHFYEDEEANRAILRKVADKCYLPANQLMLALIQQYGDAFHIAYAISGVALEQFERYAPEVLDSFKRLSDTGCVEFINETYYHSLSFLFSRTEFRRQVDKHRKKLSELFGCRPQTFRNTELIFNNELAAEIEQMGYRTILAEGADQVLGWKTPNFVYQPSSCYKLKLLLKNYRLSDDIAFRFSNQDWDGYPLTAEKFARWVHQVAGAGETVNLFMDYETIGEHQWASTGIFDFFKKLPGQILSHGDFCFHTPSEVTMQHDPIAELDVPHFVSWADVERDTTAWLGNPMQDSAVEYIFSLEEKVLQVGDEDLSDVWRKLQTSDHFYYMCTKWFSDGDVHKYFNPFETPHDAFIVYMNVLNDLNRELDKRLETAGAKTP